MLIDLLNYFTFQKRCGSCWAFSAVSPNLQLLLPVAHLPGCFVCVCACVCVRACVLSCCFLGVGWGERGVTLCVCVCVGEGHI